MNQGSKSCGVFLERIFGKIRVRDPCVTLSVRESAYFDVFSTPDETSEPESEGGPCVVAKLRSCSVTVAVAVEV